MSPRRRERAPGPTAASTLTDALRARILSGELAPGHPLREEELARAASVSRHTVRSALATLAAERLVTVQPYRGARVARFDAADVLALQELRTALECEAVRLLGERHGPAWPVAVLGPVLTSIEGLVAAGPDDWVAVEDAHAAVHLAVVAAAGSPRITEAYAALGAELRLLLLHVRPHYALETLLAEHRAYLDDVQRRGPEAVREHIAHSTALLLG